LPPNKGIKLHISYKHQPMLTYAAELIASFFSSEYVSSFTDVIQNAL